MIKKQHIRLWRRPSKDGKSFVFYLRYVDLEGIQRCESLGHNDERKAEKQRIAKEKELQMGYCEPTSMRLKEFIDDSLHRTGDQIRESTQLEYKRVLNEFAKDMGNRDIQQITLSDAEHYRQICLDRGNCPATVKKKLVEIKALFELAVKRKQLEENPVKYIKMPKVPKGEIHIYSPDECARMVKAARDFVELSNPNHSPRWDLLILVVLLTGLRRGELLNLVWEDIDVERQIVKVTPKQNTDTTWAWKIKDHDRRSLPLTDEIIRSLIDHQNRQPENHPYVFIPPARYDYIQNYRRSNGKWTYSDSRLSVLNNFYRDFYRILKRAHVKEGTFHDLRKTAICEWFRTGKVTEFDVMKLAGHSTFVVTHSFYLAVADDLMDRARVAVSNGLINRLVDMGNSEKGPMETGPLNQVSKETGTGQL